MIYVVVLLRSLLLCTVSFWGLFCNSSHVKWSISIELQKDICVLSQIIPFWKCSESGIPRSNNLTSLAARSPSALRSLSIFFDLSDASLSPVVLTAQPILVFKSLQFWHLLLFFQAKHVAAPPVISHQLFSLFNQRCQLQRNQTYFHSRWKNHVEIEISIK